MNDDIPYTALKAITLGAHNEITVGHIEYCSPVWSPHRICLINRIEKVQRFFTMRIAGL